MCLAIPGRILEVRGEDEMERSGTVDFSGVRREVSLSFVPDAQIDEWVLVHVGFAISKIDEVEAERVLSYLEEIGEDET